MENKENISNKLSEKSKDNPFTVPDGYFDTFSSRLQERLATEKKAKQSPRLIALRPYIYSVSAVAAVFILTFIFYRVFVAENHTSISTNEEIALMFEENIYDLEDTYLSDNYSDEIEAEDMIFSDEEDLSYEDEVIQYLLDENIEIETIVNEL